ncbi:MAG: ribbon-helix-helix protein, CopG family [Saccharolobus sp.]|uniref:Ribbon-helix-helix protein CopG domain-containing protein n=1 Tax=Saccharolobus shibatae TaxID=2286 RepID=A0A8F5GV53_9CREN|nr:ribbon-helix-helix protein, CopG family [Saccharolobus shibatae]MCH4814971.1 ribbon-helix-helix protein, CopG family [Saccharolobus shibatae]QXJ30541.1 hypothetical protein J5U21_00184 [Saccharolobus shibatae]
MAKTRKKILVSVYLDKEDAEALEKVAKEEALTKSTIIRKLVRAYTRRHLKGSS